MKTVKILSLLGLWGMLFGINQAGAQDLSKNSLNNSSKPILDKPILDKSVVDKAAAEQEQRRKETNLVGQIETLKGVVIFATMQDSDFDQRGIAPMTGLKTKGPAFIVKEEAAARKVVQPYLSKPLTEANLERLQTDLVLLCRRLDHPIVDVYYPDQHVTNGVIQIVIFEGKVSNVKVVNPGRKWYKDGWILSEVHLKPGESISQKQLQEDIDSLNRNGMFREVDVMLSPSKFMDDGSGTTDVELRVKDRFPLRVYGGYDNNGYRVLGEDRVFGGVNYGNLFGLDQQLNYQYTADVDLRRLSSHSASYVIPTFGSQSFVAYGGYTEVDPDLGTPYLKQNGESYQVSGLYNIPLPALGRLKEEVYFGYDFKSANQSIEFGGHTLNFTQTRVEVDQFCFGYKGYLEDSLGGTKVDLRGFYSPGDLTGNNTDAAFNTYRAGANADYVYGRFDAERSFKLPVGLVLVGRGSGQVSDGNLIAMEQLGLGGFSSVRGYGERLVNGDQGGFGSVELHRAWRLGNLTGQTGFPGQIDGDAIDFFGFFDSGYVESKTSGGGEYFGSSRNSIVLMSAGVGANLRISHNLSVSSSFGIPLRDIENEVGNASLVPNKDRNKGRGRFNVAATLSF